MMRAAIDQNCNKTWVSLLSIVAENVNDCHYSAEQDPWSTLLWVLKFEWIRQDGIWYLRWKMFNGRSRYLGVLGSLAGTALSRANLSFLIFFFPFFRCNPILQWLKIVWEHFFVWSVLAFCDQIIFSNSFEPRIESKLVELLRLDACVKKMQLLKLSSSQSQDTFKLHFISRW